MFALHYNITSRFAQSTCLHCIIIFPPNLPLLEGYITKRVPKILQQSNTKQCFVQHKLKHILQISISKTSCFCDYNIDIQNL